MTGERAGMTPEEWLDFNTDVDSWEYHATEHKVGQLLLLAADVCLVDPLPELPPVDRENRTHNQRLVSTYGAHGLRAALELNMKIELPRIYIDDVDESTLEPHEFLIGHDTMLRLGPEYRDSVNLNVIKKVEQFGKALIDEAFETLGDGALENVEKMQSDDPALQQEAMQWLSQRIKDMQKLGGVQNPDAESQVNTDAPDDMPDALLYHPIRLSPKAIGTYPNNQLEPTCLGASIIASSFFEKAGSTYMHAGVAMTAFQKRLEDAMCLNMSVKEALIEGGVSMSPLLDDKLEIIAATLYKELVEDNGYHAAVVVKCADDRWTMFDPFANVVSDVHVTKDKDLDDVHDTLIEFQTDAPALELSFRSNRLSIEYGLSRAVKKGALMLQDDEAMVNVVLLLREGGEDMADKLYQEVMLPIFESAKNFDDGNVSGGIGLILKARDEHPDKPEYDLIRRAFDTAFKRYVLWGETIEKVSAKSHIDQQYYRNRLVDIFNLPALMAATIGTINLKEGMIIATEHERIELGLPHVRVGFSVLSDFAAYTDSPLPPTFWLANWPSLIPITETMNREQNTIFQDDIVAIMAEWSRQKDLTYVKSHSIIYEFLSARKDSLKEE